MRGGGGGGGAGACLKLQMSFCYVDIHINIFVLFPHYMWGGWGSCLNPKFLGFRTQYVTRKVHEMLSKPLA